LIQLELEALCGLCEFTWNFEIIVFWGMNKS